MANKQILVGNLGGNPETHVFDSGDKVTRFSVATSERWKDKTTGEKKELTQWHNIVAKRHFADNAEKYLTKGSKVYIEGVTRHRSYEQDGVKKYVTEVHITVMEFLSPVEQSTSAAPQNTSNQKPKVFDEEPSDLPF